MLAGSGDALLLGAGKQPQKVRHMKKKQSKKSEIPLDPVATIYDKVFDLLRYLWTMAPQRLAPPIAYETDSDGELLDTKATVDHCWKEFDRFMNLYLKTFQAFTPILQEIRSLRQDSIVCESVFRTFADKQRESASLDEAIEFVEKGFKLFRRLLEEGGAVEERTEEVFYRQVSVCSRIWKQHDYDLSEIKALEAGLKWELANIENRRNPLQSTLDQVHRKPQKRKTTTPRDETIAKEKDLLFLLEQYEKWQAKMRKKAGKELRLNPSDWYDCFADWTKKTQDLFDKYSLEYQTGSESDKEAAQALICYAQKRRRLKNKREQENN